MINGIDILHKCHCGDFACHAGKKAAGLFCVVSYHHKIIVELGEYRFNSFTESLVSPCRRTPVFLIQPIWDFKGDIGRFKEILLNISTEISLVAKHGAIMIFPTNIIEITEIMDARGSHIIRMYDSTYSTDGMEFIPIVMYALRCAISPVGGCLDIIASHDTSFRSCVLTDFYRLGINAEHILGAINGDSYILADFFSKSSRKLTSGVELSAADQIWKILLTLIMQTMKEKILAVEAEGFSSYTKSDDFEVRELGNNSASGYISESLTRFPEKSLQIPRILAKFAMKLRISSMIVLSSLVTTNLLIMCELRNFFI